MDEDYLQKIVRCPRCASPLFLGQSPRCSNEACVYHKDGFPVAGAQPVLIDFDSSVFERSSYLHGSGSVLARDDNRRSAWNTARRVFSGANRIAKAKSLELLKEVKEASSNPVILVIGGGAIGSGSDALYVDPDVTVIGTDVYASPYTKLIADGHRLPFADEVFDAVWIQAVLEHVLEPEKVVSEIHRTLKPSGLVFSDTPFMQQVHEGAYDFTRFTQSGHRWLFRQFKQIDAGPSSGPGVVLTWSLRSYLMAFGISPNIAKVVAAPVFLLRYADGFAGKCGSDGAGGTYFFGRKSRASLSPKDIIPYYGMSRR